jgi:hypothetical protein
VSFRKLILGRIESIWWLKVQAIPSVPASVKALCPLRGAQRPRGLD